MKQRFGFCIPYLPYISNFKNIEYMSVFLKKKKTKKKQKTKQKINTKILPTSQSLNLEAKAGKCTLPHPSECFPILWWINFI